MTRLLIIALCVLAVLPHHTVPAFAGPTGHHDAAACESCTPGHDTEDRQTGALLGACLALAVAIAVLPLPRRVLREIVRATAAKRGSVPGRLPIFVSGVPPGGRPSLPVLCVLRR